MNDSPVEIEPSYDADRAHALKEWSESVRHDVHDPFEAARTLARKLGGHVVHEAADACATFGFWAPEIQEHAALPGDIKLEILIPTGELSLGVREQYVPMRRYMLPVEVDGDFVWSAARDLPIGSRETLGAFYQLRYRDRRGEWRWVPDHVAYSVPFGVFAPAELYDIERMNRERGDLDYWRSLPRDGDEVPRVEAPLNLLEIHIGTASPAGSVAGLTRRYEEIAAKLREGIALSPEDEPYLGYEGIQLMPIEPTTVFEGGPPFWAEELEPHPVDLPEELMVHLVRPCTTNWGYDIVISASSAVNPAILETGRPDEVVDLISLLHNFPSGPIKVVFDVVFGHADHQALPLLDRHFFLGPNMYGQDMNYRHPVVRAILLEMQRRKVNLGADGVRVDGAQDFKWWDAESQRLEHDDDYLREMANIEQAVGPVRYLPWMVFEDGRPWPRPDWEIASTYKHVIDAMPHTYQWGPLTFAHNTPAVFTFWMNKWWRVREILGDGEKWISGCANHDTVRRGTQINPNRAINHRLGETLLEILDNAYDNPAATMLFYGMFPGVPMDFLNAGMHAAWGFVRNMDAQYGVKIVAEESSFLHWQVDEISFGKPGSFRRLKEQGFDTLDELRRFMLVLSTGVEATDYDLEAIVDIMNVPKLDLVHVGQLTVERLKEICRDYMDDVHDYCNVSNYVESLDPVRTHFNLQMRELRRTRPWLRRNLGYHDLFDRVIPCRGTALFYGIRRSPGNDEELLFVGNMEGDTFRVVPRELPLPGLAGDGWSVLAATPRLHAESVDHPLELHDSAAVLFRRGGLN